MNRGISSTTKPDASETKAAPVKTPKKKGCMIL